MSLITLTSDIGSRDYVTGAIKGKLFQLCGDITIVDITHQITPFNIPQAAYVCRNILGHYPAGSFHAVFVNLFEQQQDHILAVRHGDQVLFCPDNGIITMILDKEPEAVIALPYDPKEPRNILQFTSLAAKAINWMAGGSGFESLGEPFKNYIRRNNLKPLAGDNWLEGQIVFVDHFENVVVNITREEFEKHRRGRPFKIVFKRDEVIDKISETYGDVPEGEKLALFNPAGYLEIAINQGNAAGLFGFAGMAGSSHTQSGSFAPNRLFYQTVKIYFN
jgi:S-adenosyl-L-methionine hydrolase (adenosine-forming)